LVEEAIMIASIVVPLDGSRFGEEALPYALEIARRAKAELHLVHVHVSPSFGRYPDLYVDEDRQIRTEEEIYLLSLSEQVEKSDGFKPVVAVVNGRPVDALVEYAGKVEASLVIMTTHGRGPLSWLWLGSVADGLIRRLPASTLLVRPTDKPKPLAKPSSFRHMLIPLDGSSESETILKPALELGRLLGLDYTLFQAIAPVPLMGYDITGIPTGALDLQMIQQLQESAQAYLNDTAKPLRTEGMNVRVRAVIHPNAATAINDQTVEQPNTIVALATACQGGLTRLMLGSVADKVIRGATVPVLVHRSGGLSRLEGDSHEPCRAIGRTDFSHAGRQES
jgi:nucleotide-binding universal stress UspA family protein